MSDDTCCRWCGAPVMRLEAPEVNIPWAICEQCFYQRVIAKAARDPLFERGGLEAIEERARGWASLDELRADVLALAGEVRRLREGRR